MIANRIEYRDCREVLSEWRDAGVEAQMCVTSPPYFGLRDYKVGDQIGLEATFDAYVENVVEVARLVRDILADDGTFWINLGDSYTRGERVNDPNDSKRGAGSKHDAVTLAGNYPQVSKSGSSDEIVGRADRPSSRASYDGLKPKNLLGIPWRVAFALQSDGWYLRQDIIWHKPNPMPESVRDRCTKAHEYIFLLSKSKSYYFDGDAIAQECKPSTISRISQQNLAGQNGSSRVPGKTNGNMKACFGGRLKHSGYGTRLHSGREDNGNYLERGANKRSVWTVTTKPYKGAHFATFPGDLIEPCILAGSRPGDIVLDPFMGSGTTAQVALSNGRRYLGCELNPAYRELCEKRLDSVRGVPIAAD